MSFQMLDFGSPRCPFLFTIQAAYVPWAPGTVFSVLCLVVAGIVLYLPETRGVELPTNLAALNSWYKENSGTDRNQKNKQKKVVTQIKSDHT